MTSASARSERMKTSCSVMILPFVLCARPSSPSRQPDWYCEKAERRVASHPGDKAVSLDDASRSLRRILPHEPIDGLSDEIRMTHVPRILFNQVDQNPAQAGWIIPVAVLDPLIHATLLQRLRDRAARARHRPLPQAVQLLRRVVCSGAPFPVALALPVDCVKGGHGPLPAQPPCEVDFLHKRQVLEQPAQGHGRGTEPLLQAGR